MNAPANTPATPARRVGFARAAQPAGAPAPSPASQGAPPIAASELAPNEQPTGDGADAAQPEGTSPFDGLTTIDYDAAMSHSSAGKHPGTIKTIKPNKSGTGFWVGVTHGKDNSLGGMNFLMFRDDKTKTDANGKFVRTPDVNGRKAWANFCSFFGLNPQETSAGVVAFAKHETAECPLVGVEAMFDWKDSTTAGGMLNCTLDQEATAQMMQGGDAA